MIESLHKNFVKETSQSLLKQIADDLLHSDGDSSIVRTAAADLYSLFASITGIENSSEHIEDVSHTMLTSGEAISPKDAARCVIDNIRTAKFLRGIRLAILEAQKRFPGRPIEILYAGCGPFAPLAIPLTTQFTSDEIRFTLLDIHRRSLDAARQIIQSLGLIAFVRDYIQCDAASYNHPANYELHIVVTETMQRALSKEPQVAISLNLAPQLHKRGIFIPEKISIDACLSKLNIETLMAEGRARPGDILMGGDLTSGGMLYLGRILEIDAERCRGLAGRFYCMSLNGETYYPAITVRIPDDGVGEGGHLMLLTTITVFDSITLRGHDSGLTYPAVLHDLGKVSPGAKIEFYYSMGDKPGFRYRQI